MPIDLFRRNSEQAAKLTHQPAQRRVLLFGHRDVQVLVGPAYRAEVRIAVVLADRLDAYAVAVGRKAVRECLAVLHRAALAQRGRLQALELGRLADVPLQASRALRTIPSLSIRNMHPP